MVESVSTSTEPVVMHVHDFGRRFGIGRTKLYELIRSGELEAVKIGKRTAILTASGHRYIANAPRLHGETAAV